MVSLSLVALLVFQQEEQQDQAARHQRLVQALQEESLRVAALPTLMMIEEMQVALDLDAKTTRKLELLVKRDSQQLRPAAKQSVDKALRQLGLNTDLPEIVFVNEQRVPLVDAPIEQAVTTAFGIVPHNEGAILAFSNDQRGSSQTPLPAPVVFQTANSTAWDKVLEVVPLERVGKFERQHEARKKKAVIGALFHALSYRLRLRTSQEKPVKDFLARHVRVRRSDGVFASATNLMPGLPGDGPTVLTDRQRKIWRLLRLNGYGASEW